MSEHDGATGRTSDDLLAQRYRRLLWAYPTAYRREHSDELLGTLLELASPGQRRPTAREAAALCLAGLRARAGANRHHALSEIWLGGVHLAIASLVVWYAAVPAVEDFLGLLSRHALIVAPWTGLLSVVLPVAILAAMWRRRYWLVLLLAPITPLLIPLSTWERYGQSPLGWSGFQAVAEVLPIVAIAALTLTLMRAGRSLTIGRWSGSIMMIAVLAACCTTRLFGFDTHFLGIDVVVGALVLGWTIIDVRVPIGLGLVAGTVIVPVLAETGYTMLRYQAAGFTAYDALGVAIMACVPLALLGAGALRARRQATG